MSLKKTLIIVSLLLNFAVVSLSSADQALVKAQEIFKESGWIEITITGEHDDKPRYLKLKIPYNPGSLPIDYAKFISAATWKWIAVNNYNFTAPNIFELILIIESSRDWTIDRLLHQYKNDSRLSNWRQH